MRALWIPVLLLGCDGSSPEGIEPLAGATWHRDVRPIVESSCLPCHYEGGATPLVLRPTEQELADGPVWAAAATAAVEARAMPPWHASEDCHPIAGSRALSDHEIAAFLGWREGDWPAGDPEDYEPPPPLDIFDPGPPDLELAPAAAYAADPERPDDYHCLPLGQPLEDGLWVRGVEIAPDQLAVVHHAILYVVGPEAAAEVQALDDAEQGIGYTCFGGPIQSDPGIEGSTFTNAATWVPGQVPEFLADGDARLFPAGARLVMQVHYNSLGLAAGASPPEDATSVRLWTLPEGQTPVARIETVPLANYGIEIAPGDPESRHTTTFSFGANATVIGVGPHMHQLGAALSVEVRRGDGTVDCAVDVPDWDFAWQQTYLYPPDEPFLLFAEDEVVLTCVYDNTAANQPTVQGERLEPRTVRWGEGTLDEMCLAYAHVRYPVGPGGAEGGEGDGCDAFEVCWDRCGAGDGACLATCLSGAANTCGVCGLEGLAQCAAASCAEAWSPLSACLDACEEGTLSCLVRGCRAETEAYLDCQGRPAAAGTCDPWLSECGISL